MGTTQDPQSTCDNCDADLSEVKFALRLSGYTPPTSRPIQGIPTSLVRGGEHNFCDLPCLQSWALARNDGP